MQRQRTFSVHGEKIKIVSRTCEGLCVRTTINGEKFFSNAEIVDDVSTVNAENFFEIFIQRAMDKAYMKWVKKHAKK